MDKKRFNELLMVILQAKIEMAKLWPAAIVFDNGYWREVDGETPYCLRFAGLAENGFGAMYFDAMNGNRFHVSHYGEIVPKD